MDEWHLTWNTCGPAAEKWIRGDCPHRLYYEKGIGPSVAGQPDLTASLVAAEVPSVTKADMLLERKTATANEMNNL